jgi:branched-subunit amino acid transport protein
VSLAAALTLVLSVGAITYAMRAGLILALADREIPPLAARALRNVGPAVLSALVISLIAGPGQPHLGVTAAEAGGIVVTIGLAWWRRNLMLAVSGGMAAFWILLGVT